MILRLVSGTMCLHLVIVMGRAFAEDVPEHNPPAWLDEVQTYCMMPILPESAVDLGISVNGVWAGVGSDDPILRDHEPLRKAFDNDVVAYVRAAHDAGLLVSSIVHGIEGIPPLRKICPELSEMACRCLYSDVYEQPGLGRVGDRLRQEGHRQRHGHDPGGHADGRVVRQRRVPEGWFLHELHGSLHETHDRYFHPRRDARTLWNQGVGSAGPDKTAQFAPDSRPPELPTRLPEFRTGRFVVSRVHPVSGAGSFRDTAHFSK
jgi:hypothetical protein